MGRRKIGRGVHRLAIEAYRLVCLCLHQQRAGQIVQQRRIIRPRLQCFAAGDHCLFRDLGLEDIEPLIRQAAARRLFQHRARPARIARRQESPGKREIITRLCRILGQRDLQMRQPLPHASGLHQEHAQMMVAARKPRMRRQQGAIGRFRRGQPSGAMIGQCIGKGFVGRIGHENRHYKRIRYK